jgi:hypothetical protein
MMENLSAARLGFPDFCAVIARALGQADDHEGSPYAGIGIIHALGVVDKLQAAEHAQHTTKSLRDSQRPRRPSGRRYPQGIDRSPRNQQGS